ncbi:Phosphatidylinositol:ceramide phosphoinositol transferase (IPC synthase) [Paramarasmius palmivorus]|uniref:Phosphatidylinositol:ceramide phosphoinositol transferase (IPC synthase) n=1 Tax=Paramarasmius palmivorus TaxID=297713 RepID=A0AAW0CG15_9AGAR
MLRPLVRAFISAVNRLDKSLSPQKTIQKVQNHTFTASDAVYIFHLGLASFWIYLLPLHILFKLAVIVLFATALLIPLTSQFFLPAIPVFTYLLSFFSSRFIPPDWRPNISVALLPTLESVLYGANISDILTRYTHSILDILAWLPYGVLHYTFPFILAFFLWVFRPKESLHLFAAVLGYMNLTGVLIQLFFPCAAPWYELVYGLTPANYAIKGSPGGLIRIDRLFHSQGYTTAFTNSPLVFGAFPSLHSATATLDALFLSHFFPWTTKYAWGYAGVLYWSTMYLTHHYLVDVVGGACMAVGFFYVFLPDALKGERATSPPGAGGANGRQRNKYSIYGLEAPSTPRVEADFDLPSDDEEAEVDVRKPSSSTPAKKGHRHTASIARLIDSRGEDAA